jgi:hypothetical protein
VYFEVGIDEEVKGRTEGSVAEIEDCTGIGD